MEKKMTRTWRYHCQNPAVALRAIAYRAVMRSAINLTLSQALSQNLATLTKQMRARAQKEADTLGLGVDIIGFTVGGMHPPVPVAPAYEEVVSAEVARASPIDRSGRSYPARHLDKACGWHSGFRSS
jgi:regulator of protease activity HflC (stomatin/prohibitin superfamily)